MEARLSWNYFVNRQQSLEDIEKLSPNPVDQPRMMSCIHGATSLCQISAGEYRGHWSTDADVGDVSSSSSRSGASCRTGVDGETMSYPPRIRFFSTAQ